MIKQEGDQKCARNLIATDSSLFGMTCDGMDVLAKNINLPVELKVGDWLVFGGMGSYTVGPRSEFNGMKALTRIEDWSSAIETETSQKPEVKPQASVEPVDSQAQPFISMNSQPSSQQSSDEENILSPVRSQVKSSN
jgi:hypothetical protein